VSTTDTVLLGLIAAGVLLMAGGQVTAVIMAIRATRRVGDTLNRLEDSIRPIVSNVQQMSEDAARATAIATAQVAKAERMMDDVSRKIDETMDMVQHTILAPARNGMAMLEGLKAAFGAFFSGGNSGRRRSPRPASVAEDDASFIG
jgi:outer membrane murein-binding lipoprotein Lpp